MAHVIAAACPSASHIKLPALPDCNCLFVSSKQELLGDMDTLMRALPPTAQVGGWGQREAAQMASAAVHSSMLLC